MVESSLHGVFVALGLGQPHGDRAFHDGAGQEAYATVRADFKGFDKILRRRGGKSPREGDENLDHLKTFCS